MLQVVDNAVFWQIVRKRSTQSEFLDVYYCGHVTYQIWAWFETFKGNVNRTTTVNFDAHWTSGAKKRRFSDFLSNRFVVKFLPLNHSLRLNKGIHDRDCLKFLINNSLSDTMPWKNKNTVYRLQISALVPEIFKFEKFVIYANEMTDDVKNEVSRISSFFNTVLIFYLVDFFCCFTLSGMLLEESSVS